MYQVVKKLTRPDKSVEFPNLQSAMDPVHFEHFVTNYVLTGKHIFRHTEYDITELELTTTILWDSLEAWEEFSNDPVMISLLANNSRIIESRGIIQETVSLSEF